MSSMKHPSIIAGSFEALSNQSLPALQFHLPSDSSVSKFQYAVWGKNPNGQWVYFDPATSKYQLFEPNGKQFTHACLVEPVFQNRLANLQLPTGAYLSSGVVVMFSGKTKGIPVAVSGTPSVPTISTNPGEVFGLFELTYAVPAGASVPILDIDISNIDQISLPFTVKSSGPHVPFPMSYVGTALNMEELAVRFKSHFDDESSFAQCLRDDPKQLIAPQDILAHNLSPNTLPVCTPSGTLPPKYPYFLQHSYYYRITETLPHGETTASPPVYSGILLNTDGKPQASEVKICWGSAAHPARYVPHNSEATHLNIYRASVRPANAPASGEPANVPSAPEDLGAYDLLKTMSIEAWNAQPNFTFIDSGSAQIKSSKHPPATNYGINTLSTWFDKVLTDFFAHYTDNEFVYYQTHQQGTGSHGTMWRGKVKLVTPNTGQLITQDKYWGSDGKQSTPTAKWQWGDGTASYLVLQLIGNAYDGSDLRNTDLSGVSKATTGEYEGDVLNIYFPYFKENTGLSSVSLSEKISYTVPPAPDWMENAGFFPGQMVFGCAGVFATGNDPDAIKQAIIMKNGVPARVHGKLQYNGLASRALTNLENVMVSAMNRGVATGYNFTIAPQQYTCTFAFSQPASIDEASSGVPKGIYTYYLAGVLKDGTETTLCVPQTVHLDKGAAVTLHWKPQPEALYEAIRVYRRKSGETSFQANKNDITNTNGVSSYTDKDQFAPATPFVFYAGLNDAD